jgi:hypothetical protein
MLSFKGRCPVKQLTRILNSTRPAQQALLAVLIAIGVSSCQKNDSSSGVTVHGSGTAGQNAASAGLTLNGGIYTDASQQSAFQDAVGGFVNAIIDDQQYLGQVSATMQNGTGVLMGGRVNLASGTLRSAGTGQQSTINPNSVAYVAVYDGTKDTNGAALPPIGRYFSNGAGTISGNYATLTFTDDYGTIRLEGQFDTTKFVGTFSYENQRRFDGTNPGAAGTMGTFQLPTCQFFTCN